MRLRNKISLFLIPFVILSSVVALSNPEFDYWDEVQYVLITSVSYLLAIASFSLFRSEPSRGTGVVFLNFALLFGTNTVFRILFDIVNWYFLQWDRDANAYFFQYSWLLYFLLLSLSVAYLVVDAIWKRRMIYEKYLVTVFIVGSTWGCQSYPYLKDPRYLSKEPEVLDYLAVRRAMAGLRSDGNLTPSAADIAGVASLKFSTQEVGDDAMGRTSKEKRVSEILPYFRGEDFGTLYWRPLFEACSRIGMVCTFIVLIFIVFQYLKDPPREAYTEKIVWCLLLYCSFEALHFFAFSQVAHWETLDAVSHYGGAFSMVVMLVLLLLVSIRLRFIHSVEGGYYERRLIDGADSITRWRDAFDNWVLRQFMDPKELDRRFVIRRNTESDLQD